MNLVAPMGALPDVDPEDGTPVTVIPFVVNERVTLDDGTEAYVYTEIWVVRADRQDVICLRANGGVSIGELM